MSKRKSLILIVVLALATFPALAAGFGFYESGAKASGQGGAWVARADDAAANWYNPAALVRTSGMEVQFGLNYLEIGGDTQFKSSAYGSHDSVSNTSTPAHFYFSQKINDRVAWGVGLNNPFGLVTEWNTLPTPFLVSSPRRSELNTYLLNPNLAISLSEKWSLAIGADYISAEVREFSSKTNVGLATLTSNLTGEGDAWGYNFALLFRTKDVSIAGQYRSPMRPTISGHVTVSGAGPSTSLPAEAKLDLPGQTMLGLAWTGKWVDIEVGGYYTQWNYFKTLDVDTGNPSTSFSIPEYWEGTWSGRIGLAFRLDKSMQHELRIGGVYDEGAIPVEHLRPSIPDSKRKEATLGYGYLAKRWGIDVYAMNVWFDDITAVTASGTATPDGVFPGTYTSTIWLAGVTAKYRF